MALKDFTGTPAEKAKLESDEKASYQKERANFNSMSKDRKPAGSKSSNVLTAPTNTGVRISSAVRKDRSSALAYLKSRKPSMANKPVASGNLGAARLAKLKEMAGK
jgi:hypothetical protein